MSKNTLKFLALLHFIIGAISYYMVDPINAIYWVLAAIFFILCAN